VVEVGFTVHLPEAVEVLNEPGLIAMLVIVPAAFHESVDVPAEATMEGDAKKEVMEGADPFVTLTVVNAVEVLFEVSVESAQRVVEPLAADAVFQGIEYSVPLAVEVDPTRVLEAKLVPKEAS
jgi:hypothetical protein